MHPYFIEDMAFDYTIKYKSNNTYENPVFEAYWQFMIIPENNVSQKLVFSDFKTSVNARIEKSINGYNFQTARIHCKQPFGDIQFEAEFKLTKEEINPFQFTSNLEPSQEFEAINSLNFKIEHESYLTPTELTKLPSKHLDLYKFDPSISILDNLVALNKWTYLYIYFKAGVTHIGSLLDEIIEHRHGVCQDFSHLFIAIARQNNIPARYVSGYLHQGDGFFGDSQMHAWVEAYIPEVGWVGFDPANDILADHNHIKVSHGKDYNDCSPIKGVIYSTGKNETQHSVEVTYEQ
ncbi:transglutaminase family protein [Mangrovimonas sp. DI 80]|uniref:transglutaminase-like domain-containing protein n=1 Tax=Mangrovimonas sp. DI 80 TaxID=1779330 RepID=UPI00209B39D8|nr:transglutaminase family protein [Mangrovimonas sp. DI 80]